MQHSASCLYVSPRSGYMSFANGPPTVENARMGTWLQCRCFRVTGRLGGRRRILSFDVSVFGLKALEFRVEFWAQVR